MTSNKANKAIKGGARFIQRHITAAAAAKSSGSSSSSRRRRRRRRRAEAGVEAGAGAGEEEEGVRVGVGAMTKKAPLVFELRTLWFQDALRTNCATRSCVKPRICSI